MNTVRFGSTNEMVSEICLGTMMFGDRCDEKESARVLDTAIERGINFVDTAAMYMDGVTEEILGRIMKGKRSELFIGTKVRDSTAGSWIVESLDRSLKRMRTDYVDLYMIHWPLENMRIEEMLEALDETVRSGKARFIGCCNFPAWLFAHCNAVAEANGWTKMVCNQVPYNLIERGVEVEVLPQAAAESIAITTYRPVLLGLLAGKYRPGNPIPLHSRGMTDERIPRWLHRYETGFRKFLAFAEERDLHPVQLSLAWLLKSPAVTSAILGVSSAGQLQESLGKDRYQLSDREYQEVAAMFDTQVKEEAGGLFPSLRRSFHLLAAS
jgi:aryl-alcohol dehydrogenase-like predicted oxidoreductase